MHAPVLLMLNESFEVGALDLCNVVSASRLVKLEKKHDRGEGALDRFRLVVHPPLVAQVVLEMLPAWKIQKTEPFKDAVDRGAVAYGFGATAG
jgi:hypothetical protein